MTVSATANTTSPATHSPEDLRAPLIAFALASAVYMALDASAAAGNWMALLKIVPILILGWLANRHLGATTRLLALAALALSATGDVLLAVPFSNHFVFGLGAFLLAQLTYTANFLRAAHFGSRRFVLRGVAIVVAAWLLARQVLPGAGELAVPVACYIGAIVAMALSAAAHRSGSSLLFAGAVTFMVSDALIAINRFVDPVPLAGTWIMLTYYVAQALLVFGLIRAELASHDG